MDFSGWLQQDELNAFMERVKNHVLAGMRPINDKMVGINFPKKYEVLFQQQPKLQVAHTVYEGYGPGHGGTKGDRIVQFSPEPFKQSMTPPEQERFSKKMTQSLRHIARPMGLVFEAGVFIYLTKKGLKTRGEKDVNWAAELIQEKRKEIESSAGKFVAEKAIQLISWHAKDMGEKIYQKTHQLMKRAVADFVSFEGGEHIESGSKRSTADLIVGNSSGVVGWSLKYATEQEVIIANFRQPVSMYTMLGGTSPSEFNRKVEDGGRDYIVKVYHELAQNISRRRLNTLINNLLFGQSKSTLPAFLNYALGRGEAGFPDILRQDFHVDDRSSAIIAKPEAEIKVWSKSSFLKINIKADSQTGTTLTIRVRNDGQVEVGMNHLS